MNINDLTYGEIKEISALINTSKEPAKPVPFVVGKKYLLRTVTHIDVGLISEVYGNFLVLTNASWVADTGRFYDCLKKGIFNEVEPYPDGVIVNISALIDAALWNHALPTDQK